MPKGIFRCITFQFALVREGAKRVLGLFHIKFKSWVDYTMTVTLRMRTGEGKLLTATMPVYLNALSGRRSSWEAVNEYLASRDAREMGI